MYEDKGSTYMYKPVVFISVLLILTGCDLLPPLCGDKIISHKVSPDKRVDAIILETNCGATTSYVHKVYIFPSGSDSLDLDYPVFAADRTEGLKIGWVAKFPTDHTDRWAVKQQLYIGYDKARIFKYTNSWHSRELDNFEYLIEITETRMSNNSALD